MLDKETIKELALANGFKLKEQADGSMDLNPYVYQFAAALERLATAELKAQVEQLRELAEFWINQSKPVGGRKDEYMTWLALGHQSAAMNATPAQCLAEIKAQAGRDGFIAGADSYFDRHSDEEMSEHVLNSADQYANQLREQAKGAE